MLELLKYTILSDIKVGQKYLQNLAICKNTGAPLFLYISSSTGEQLF